MLCSLHRSSSIWTNGMNVDDSVFPNGPCKTNGPHLGTQTLLHIHAGFIYYYIYIYIYSCFKNV